MGNKDHSVMESHLSSDVRTTSHDNTIIKDHQTVNENTNERNIHHGLEVDGN